MFSYINARHPRYCFPPVFGVQQRAPSLIPLTQDQVSAAADGDVPAGEHASPPRHCTTLETALWHSGAPRPGGPKVRRRYIVGFEITGILRAIAGGPFVL